MDDLKTHELPSIHPSKSLLDSVEFRGTLTNSLSNVVGSTTITVAAMLETAMDELFAPYIEGQKYLDRESKDLTELYAGLLSNFSQYHVSDGHVDSPRNATD